MTGKFPGKREMHNSLSDRTTGDRSRFVQRQKLTACLAAGAAVLAWPAQVAAQAIAPSQVTPRSIAPAPAAPAVAPLANGPAPEAELPGGGDLGFTAGEALIEGGFPEMASAHAAFAARVGRQPTTVAALFAAARDLEQAYARAGYVLARVTVPHQRIADGQPVRVVVTDGFIEAIDAGHVPAAIRPRVMARLAGLIGRRHLTEAQIERRLLVPGQLPGLSLRSALARGSQPGGVLLVLEGTAERVSARMAGENLLPASLGRWQIAGNLALNNLIGAGEQLYMTGAVAPGDTGIGTARAPLRMVGGGIMLPLGTAGTTVAGEYLSSRTRPRSQRGVPDALGTFERVQGRVRVPVVLRRASALNLDVTVDGVRQALRLPGFGIDLSRDHYAALRVGLGWRGWLGHAPVTLETTFSQGLGGRRASALLPLSRQGASPQFSRLEGTARASLRLAGGFGIDLALRGQTGFGQAQPLSEQFSLDAADGVSTFASGSFNLDSGATVRGELRLPVPAFAKELAPAPYVFAAAGSGTLARPTALEQRRVTAGVVGLGARLALGTPIGKASLGAEYGYQLSNLPERRRGHRAAVSLSFGF